MPSEGFFTVSDVFRRGDTVLNRVQKEFVVFAGLLAVPAVAGMADHRPVAGVSESDSRLARLRAFFTARKCPVTRLAADFIAAADQYGLDWRLLPSISVIESGGGKQYRNNNIFGWDSCRRVFPSVRAGIHIVAAKLGNSRRYKDKSVDAKLSAYNPNPEYAERVKAVMRTIGEAGPSGSAELDGAGVD
jgi:hypothetical protein